MNSARILILALAAVAAAAAAYFVYSRSGTPEPQVVERPVERAPAVRVLAARGDLETGARIAASDLYWQPWPEEAVSPAYVTESRSPDAIEEFVGAIVRASIAQGEPITPRKLVPAGEAGFMSAVLTPGMRAVAVPLSAETGAGGFILPNDRVDVIVTYEEDGSESYGRGGGFIAETVVENTRVLAIDQIFGEDEEEGAVVGSTATLELTPDQARAVTLAVARGEVSLALRSLTDGDGGPRLSAPEVAQRDEAEDDRDRGRNTMTVYRYGQRQDVALGDGG